VSTSSSERDTSSLRDPASITYSAGQFRHWFTKHRAISRGVYGRLSGFSSAPEYAAAPGHTPLQKKRHALVPYLYFISFRSLSLSLHAEDFDAYLFRSTIACSYRSLFAVPPPATNTTIEIRLHERYLFYIFIATSSMPITADATHGCPFI
jgi:hypothetical protein